MIFAEAVAAPREATGEAWKVLIVDDEADVHTGTRLALDDFSLHGRSLQFLHAYSGAESVEIMRRERDIALVLMDVVMETEHAGLDAIRAIRSELANRFVRIVLRTGQPGQAPEKDVVRSFDINDYKEKTELTGKKLFTLVHT
ncbi:MAG: response regulator, partial [Sinimarinibacterium sp.]